MERQLEMKIYKGNNPFDNRNKYYIYYPYEYLYNMKMINNRLKKNRKVVEFKLIML